MASIKDDMKWACHRGLARRELTLQEAEDMRGKRVGFEREVFHGDRPKWCEVRPTFGLHLNSSADRKHGFPEPCNFRMNCS
jgi:hypothetical protein